MATDYGNHVTKFVGLRGQIGDVDPRAVLVILDRSHSNFTMADSRYNFNNPGWFSEFAKKTNAKLNSHPFSVRKMLYGNVDFPDLTEGIKDVLNHAKTDSVSLGWIGQQTQKGWVNVERRLGGIVYPICSIHRNDTKYEIINDTAAAWFTRENRPDGNNYSRIVNLHGDYKGNVTVSDMGVSSGHAATFANTKVYESGGWSMLVVNIFGNLELHIPKHPRNPNVTRQSVFVNMSDDMQLQVNVFGKVTLTSDTLGWFVSSFNRGHTQLNIMPGGELHVKGNSRMAVPRYTAVFAWDDAKYSGTVANYY